MADLNFSQVQSKLPSNALVASGSDIVISAKALMGESAVALTDQKIGEFLSKLLDAVSRAQTDYNAASNPTDFRSYPTPVASAPILNPTTGIYYSSFTYTITVQAPLNRDSVEALETAPNSFF